MTTHCYKNTSVYNNNYTMYMFIPSMYLFILCIICLNIIIADRDMNDKLELNFSWTTNILILYYTGPQIF